jgi:hypothetical protein
MKIVVNRCFGGFSLSTLAVLEYCKLAGIKVFCYVDDQDRTARFDKRKFVKIDPLKSGADHFMTYWLKTDLGEVVGNKEFNGADWLHDREIDRDDPFLIEVVEKLGDKANGRCAELEIVEIPDGVDWEIDEYDGSESIHEKHRSW